MLGGDGHLVVLGYVGVMVCRTLPLSLWLLPSQDPSWNHRVYRLALTKLSPPIIPFMPLLLKGNGSSMHIPPPPCPFLCPCVHSTPARPHCADASGAQR